MGSHFDARLLERLKIENCHLDLDICGTAEKHFLVASPGKKTFHFYYMEIMNECNDMT
jgi:hypothetical protein